MKEPDSFFVGSLVLLKVFVCNFMPTMDKKIMILATAAWCVCAGHAANISFADSQVKTLCVQNWDSNKDGELSEAEAAAVTSLGNVFKGNKNITSFEELRYFSGLSTINDYAFYQSTIQKVAFPTSVTEIGEYAFSQSGISGELRIPGTVKRIRNYAFYTCKQLTSIILEEGVETVGWHSLSGPISTLSLPSTLTSMSSMAIDPYVNAGSSSGIFVPEGELYVYVHSSTPAVIDYFAFYFVFGDGHLIVPYGAKEAYQSAEGWSQFREYLEYGDVNMDGYVNNRDVISTRAFILGNNPSPFHEKMADVNGDGTINNRDVILLRNNVMK